MDRGGDSASTLEFLRWVARQSRTYEETMDAWRSSCPRFTIWEDALAEGLVEVGTEETLLRSAVRLTDKGFALVAELAD